MLILILIIIIIIMTSRLPRLGLEVVGEEVLHVPRVVGRHRVLLVSVDS